MNVRGEICLHGGEPRDRKKSQLALDKPPGDWLGR